MTSYPRRRSKVTVEFTDGQVKHYTITAGAGISQYLANELQTGALRLSDYDTRSSVIIPTAQIVQVSLQEIIEDEPQPAAPSEDDRAFALTDPITDLEMSGRAVAALHRDNVTTVQALLHYDIRRLNHVKGAGVKVKREVTETIAYLRELFRTSNGA